MLNYNAMRAFIYVRSERLPEEISKMFSNALKWRQLLLKLKTCSLYIVVGNAALIKNIGQTGQSRS